MSEPVDGSLEGSGDGRPLVALLSNRREGRDRRFVIRTPRAIHQATTATVASLVRSVEHADGPRWVWSAADDVGDALAELHVLRSWDVSEAHRMLFGDPRGGLERAWAARCSLPLDGVPEPSQDTLFSWADSPGTFTEIVRPDGYLDPRAVSHIGSDDGSLAALADAVIDIAIWQGSLAESISTRTRAAIHAESATSLLCLELARDGLPLHRGVAEELIADLIGPRPRTPEDEAAARHHRDARVLATVPGRESTDLRNPAAVRTLLAAVGISVPNTRKWVLEGFRDAHPLVPALLEWRRRERIATTYGYRWLDGSVGADNRLRGHWTACDGAGGRMTADSGLHNLPVSLRPAVVADEGHVFVRSDLGQIEPRVLAVVSGDPALARATLAEDLYAPIATELAVERSVAKIAVLAAMYGQRSGVAGEVLDRLARAYPVAMSHLDTAYTRGVAGRDLRTWGGRRVATGQVLVSQPVGADPTLDAARGRFARNAVVQGAAAELFKAWAATVRAAVHSRGGVIVLCLHDELLIHAPESAAGDIADLVDQALDAAARRWSQGAPVRFVADTTIVQRWSQAKDDYPSGRLRRNSSKSAPNSSADGSSVASVANRLGRA